MLYFDRYTAYQEFRDFCHFVWRTACYTAIAVGSAVTIVAAHFGTLVWLQLRQVPDLAYADKYSAVKQIQFFDRHDKLVCTIEGYEKRDPVSLNQMSLFVQQAVVAAEDRHFFEHHGINPTSVIRAFLVNALHGHVVEGGSTITQQLVKNLFFEDSGRTIERKIAEAIVAEDLEKRFSKRKILEMYLNQVYFGNGAYGIEQAARAYFAKSAFQLNLAESAFLAGVLKSPSTLGAPEHRVKAMERQREILDKMASYGYITSWAANAAKMQYMYFRRGVLVRDAKPIKKYPYYISYVIELLQDRFDAVDLRSHSLKVYTNLDVPAQEIAERVLNERLKHAPAGVNQAALVCMNVRDSAVLALVGGVGDYWQNQWNCATNPHTVGSSFKPFVYLAAINKGLISPDSTVDDLPLVIDDPDGSKYVPKNFDGRFMGPISVRTALAQSRNVCAIRVAQLAGIESVTGTARLAGIRQRIEPHLAMALGSCAVSPLEMAGAYATLARGGVLIRPSVLRRVEDSHGRVIETFAEPATRVFDLEPIAEILSMLQDVVNKGTGVMAKLPGRPVAGKTGTADQAKDLWFIGCTPDTCAAVWGGNKDNKPIPGTNVTGGTVMARIWRDFMQSYYRKYPTAAGSFPVPLKGNNSAHDSRPARLTPVAVHSAPARRIYQRKTQQGRAGIRLPSSPVSAASRKGVTEYRWQQ